MADLTVPPPNGETVTFTEEQAIRQLSRTAWQKDGNNLVSHHTYTPEAVAQIEEPLTRATRDAIKFRTEPSDDGSRQLLMQARDAERFFNRRGLTPNIENQETARVR
jgi:hypothetical protein